jgi:hypothetical protein
MRPESALREHVSYDEVAKALVDSEREIYSVFTTHFVPDKQLTYADFFGMGIGRRTLALSSGFRSMVEQRNSLCALPIVRMQLDTALRLYAGFFVTDHQEFCEKVVQGKQINQLKSDDGSLMSDGYLRDRVAKRNSWMIDVYKSTSGYIHFSIRHIQEAIRKGDGSEAQMIIGPNDFDRELTHFLEPMKCMLHLSLVIRMALTDWFARMCHPNGVTISAQELWAKHLPMESD